MKPPEETKNTVPGTCLNNTRKLVQNFGENDFIRFFPEGIVLNFFRYFW